PRRSIGTIQCKGGWERTLLSTKYICLPSSLVGAMITAKHPESLCSFDSPPADDVIRWITGSRYASVLPEPVSAWMKASESEEMSWGTATCWIEVGASRF